MHLKFMTTSSIGKNSDGMQWMAIAKIVVALATFFIKIRSNSIDNKFVEK